MINAGAAYTVAVWVELFLYGIYTCLFTAVISESVVLKRRSSRRGTSSSWVFLVATMVMYVVATFHIIVQLYSFLRAFVFSVEPQGYLVYYLDFQRWDNMANSILLCVMSLLGDVLVIYRCYFVWSPNSWVIVPPTLLLLVCIGTSTYILYWFDHPFNVDPKIALAFLDAIYPIAFLQNVMTTGLISFKLLYQWRVSRASGVTDRGSRLNLLRILRSLVESALIYTLELLLLIIFSLRDNDFQIIVRSASMPSIGIAFVLMAVRIQAARSECAAFGLEEGNNSVEPKRTASPPAVGTTSSITVRMDRSRDSDSEVFVSSISTSL